MTAPTLAPTLPATGPSGAAAVAHLPVYGCRILVVDDTDFNRALIGALLRAGGFYNVGFAEDGVRALETIAAEPPDLVILDIMMPGLDGFEVCRRLRSDHAFADLPVLVQTALSSPEDRSAAFAAGTTDLISKPIERGELLARVRIHLENLLMIRSLQSYRQRVEGELAVARSMYEHLLPSRALCEGSGRALGVEIRGHAALSCETGGALWGLLPLPGGALGVFVLDMTEHGVAGALNAFRIHTLIQETATGRDDPGAFLRALNERAHGLLDGEASASLAYGVLDADGAVFRYAVAGTVCPLLVPAERDAELPDIAATPSLGIVPDGGYTTRSLPFGPGSVLVIPSENLREHLTGAAPGEAGSRLERAVRAARPDRFEALVQGLDESAPGEDSLLVWIGRGPAAP